MILAAWNQALQLEVTILGVETHAWYVPDSRQVMILVSQSIAVALPWIGLAGGHN